MLHDYDDDVKVPMLKPKKKLQTIKVTVTGGPYPVTLTPGKITKKNFSWLKESGEK